MKHFIIWNRNQEKVSACDETVRWETQYQFFGWNGTTSRKDVTCGNCKRTKTFKKDKWCAWTYDEHHEKWDTSCGEAFCFIDSGPKENKMKFCCYCGKKLKEQR